MTCGYAVKILRINLSTRYIGSIDTAQYEAWGGGHGMGSAIFWDLCQDKTVSGFDPRNVITIMSTPLAGTLAPGAGRCEVQGIGPQGHPSEWFTWSNFGGRPASTLGTRPRPLPGQGDTPCSGRGQSATATWYGPVSSISTPPASWGLRRRANPGSSMQ